MGGSTFGFSTGEALLITADVPTVSQITRTSAGTIYISAVIDIDPAVSRSWSRWGSPPFAAAPVRIEPAESEVVEAAPRLLRLLGRPVLCPMLEAQHIRELHFWLLSDATAARSEAWASLKAMSSASPARSRSSALARRPAPRRATRRGGKARTKAAA